MRQIDVQITKGQIESFHVNMVDNLPEVSATVALFTADNKKITTFSISSQKWCDPKFEVPIEMIQPILSIAERLERIVILECNRKLQRIEAPPKKDPAPQAVEPEAVAEVQDDEPAEAAPDTAEAF